MVTPGQKTDLQFQIEQLRQEKLIWGVYSLAVSVMAVITTVFLPEILFRYIYSSLQLQTEPVLLSLIAPVSYGVAAVVFLYTVGSGIFRCRTIRMLEKELQGGEKKEQKKK